MISIDKTSVEKPKNLIYKPCLNAIAEVVASKNGEKINCIYNSAKVKESLLKLYNNKCAYCESKINPATSSVRIDHYRPKDKVKDINSNEIVGHNGYYWLGYEWTNFLPTCEICNSKKSNIFPLKDETQRRYEPELLSNNKIDESKQLLNSDFLKNETALTLNPEIDKPENYFVFLTTGELKPVSINGVDIEKGVTTIKVCGLDRDELIIARKNKIDDYIEKLRKHINEYFTDLNENNKEKKLDILKSKAKDVFSEILTKTYPKYEYSRLHCFIVQKSDDFIFSKFDSIPRHKQLIVDLYSNFRNGAMRRV